MTDLRTDITERLAEAFIPVLDHMSRATNAAHGSSLPYFHEKVDQLDLAVTRLLRSMSASGGLPGGCSSRPNPTMRYDGERLRAIIASGAQSHLAGRHLFPIGDDPAAAAAAHGLRSAATQLEFGLPVAGLSPAQATAVANWLRDRAQSSTAKP